MKRSIVVAIVLAAWPLAALAATPPDRIHYQGVLRDPAGNPLDGSHDMVFRFMSAETGGVEILVDAHEAAAGQAVLVDNGLLGVTLGAGVVTDGSGAGTYLSLAEVFRDYPQVWLAVEVNGEALTPRIPVLSAGYALNADHLDGSDSSFFLNTSSAAQTKAGPLTVDGEVESTAGGFRFPDGSIQSAAHVPENVIHRLDAIGRVGRYTSVVIGTDGNPVISYHDFVNESLKIAFCSDPGCSSATFRTVVPGLGVAGPSSMALRRGNPVISYYQSIGQDLAVAYCDAPDCSSVTEVPVDSGSDDVGDYNSIAVLADDSVVISYYDRTTGDLKVARCVNPGCASPTINTVDATADAGTFTSIAVGADGNPVISYRDEFNDELRVADCGDPGCAGAVRNTVAAGGVENSIAVHKNGRPVIAYDSGQPDHDLRVAYCDDAACTSAAIATVDSDGQVGASPSIAIAPGGSPVIGYLDLTNYDLKFAECYDAGCSSAAVLRLDAEDFVGQFGSIAVGSDGKPVISYQDETNDDLKVITQVTGAVGAAASPFTGLAADAETPVATDLPRSPAPARPRVGRIVSRPPGLPDPGAGLRTDAEGNVYARSFRPSAAEMTTLVTVGGPVQAGDVLALDPERPGLVDLARRAEDSGVFGVVAARPGVLLGAERPGALGSELRAAVSVSGIAVCKADAGYGSIRPGDLLTTSPTPGHAMRADRPRPGTILGKALDPLDVGTGTIRILVMLR